MSEFPPPPSKKEKPPRERSQQSFKKGIEELQLREKLTEAHAEAKEAYDASNRLSRFGKKNPFKAEMDRLEKLKVVVDELYKGKVPEQSFVEYDVYKAKKKGVARTVGEAVLGARPASAHYKKEGISKEAVTELLSSLNEAVQFEEPHNVVYKIDRKQKPYGVSLEEFKETKGKNAQDLLNEEKLVERKAATPQKIIDLDKPVYEKSALEPLPKEPKKETISEGEKLSTTEQLSGTTPQPEQASKNSAEHPLSPEEAIRNLETIAGGFSLREGFVPFANDNEALAALDKALLAYRVAVRSTASAQQYSQIRGLIPEVRANLVEQRIVRMGANEQRKFISRLDSTEESEVRGNKIFEEQRKKRVGFIRASLVALLASLGVAGGKYAVDNAASYNSAAAHDMSNPSPLTRLLAVGYDARAIGEEVPQETPEP